MQSTWTHPTPQNRSAWDQLLKYASIPTPGQYLQHLYRTLRLHRFPGPLSTQEYSFFYPIPDKPKMWVRILTNINQNGFIELAPSEIRMLLLYDGLLWRGINTRWPNQILPAPGELPSVEWLRFENRVDTRFTALVDLGKTLQLCPTHWGTQKILPYVSPQDKLWWYCNSPLCDFAIPVDDDVSEMVQRHTSPSFWKEMH